MTNASPTPRGLLWRQEEDARLEKLWPTGLSCSQLMAHFPGRSRNSIIGRVHRLKLASRGSPLGKHSARKTKKAKDTLYRTSPPITLPVASPSLPILKALADEMKQKIKEDEVPSEGLDLMELESHHCRWVIGDPMSFPPHKFCGKPKDGESSYCSEHHARATDRTKKYHTPLVSNREMAA